MVRLEELGQVINIVQTGHIVVKPASGEIVGKLKLGYKVYSEGRKEVGWVSDLIGNVNAPYIVVKAKDRSVINSVQEGALLYVEVPPPKKPRRRRAPRPGRRKTRREARAERKPRRPGRGGSGGRGKRGR